jgi:hypothetical protein
MLLLFLSLQLNVQLLLFMHTFFKMGIIAPTSASVDAHNRFIAES